MLAVMDPATIFSLLVPPVIYSWALLIQERFKKE